MLHEDNLNDHSEDEYFFVDSYNEEQIKQLIIIFKNDYKPPKSLWIEKNGVTSGYNNLNGTGSEYIDMSGKNCED